MEFMNASAPAFAADKPEVIRIGSTAPGHLKFTLERHNDTLATNSRRTASRSSSLLREWRFGSHDCARDGCCRGHLHRQQSRTCALLRPVATSRQLTLYKAQSNTCGSSQRGRLTLCRRGLSLQVVRGKKKDQVRIWRNRKSQLPEDDRLDLHCLAANFLMDHKAWRQCQPRSR